MEYTEARALLDRLPRFEVKPGLERTRRLLDALGHPELSFPAIHVGGTNGKGSVVAMLDAVLRRSDYRVGRFTSPEVLDFRDRIAVEGEWVTDAELAEETARIEGVLVTSGDPPTQFEAIAALAFDHFARRQVDVALVEVGLGGRFDATNLVSPLLTILTNVAKDHVQLLGDSVERIAWEKAGIAKPGVPLLYGRLSEDALRVVLDECELVKAVPVSSEEITVERVRVDWDAAHYRVTGFPGRIALPLLGGYQAENLRLVLAAVGVLRKTGFRIPNEAVVEGLRTVRWPGRFEVVHRSPTVVLDGAHNVAGAEALAADLATFIPRRDHRHLLFGVLADKDVSGIARALVPMFSYVVLSASRSSRALPAEELRDRLTKLAGPLPWYDSVERALDAVFPLLEEGDTLVVAGSLSVVAEARQWFVEGRWRQSSSE